MDHYFKDQVLDFKRKKNVSMIKSKKTILFIYLTLLSLLSYGQNGGVAMADEMRSNGKIYVVIAVMATILAGLILYLYRLDRKISRLEKDADQ